MGMIKDEMLKVVTFQVIGVGSKGKLMTWVTAKNKEEAKKKFKERYIGYDVEKTQSPEEVYEEAMKQKLEEVKCANLVATSHSCVFYLDEADRYDRGEFEAACRIANAFPGFKVVISMGPWRAYDIRYYVFRDEKLISLDYYSVHPGLQYTSEIIHEIETILEKR